MMEDAKAAAGNGTKVVAVTMLTSLDAADLTSTGVYGSAETQVMRLAELAHAAGLDGIVCSGQEVGMVRKAWKDGFFVVPGLRPNGNGTGDQKRVVTPRQARDNGASVLVIGRPISRAEDPEAAARAIEARHFTGLPGGHAGVALHEPEADGIIPPHEHHYQRRCGH